MINAADRTSPQTFAKSIQNHHNISQVRQLYCIPKYTKVEVGDPD